MKTLVQILAGAITLVMVIFLAVYIYYTYINPTPTCPMQKVRTTFLHSLSKT